MIEKKLIEQLVTQKINETDYFLVDIKVSEDNNIIVEIDRNDGVDIEFCVNLSKHIENSLDRDVEDFALEVGSAGITSPFKVLKQYEKNIGNEVEVLVRDGLKYKGELVSVSEDKFSIEEIKMLKKEGDKRKKEYKEVREFNYKDIKSTKYIINIK